MSSKTEEKEKRPPSRTSSSLSTDSGQASPSSLTDSSPSSTEKKPWVAIPYTISLPLLVMLDMVGVALVVPLLHSQYFAVAGVTSAVQREWLSSLFSASQIAGGLLIGTLTDSKVLSRRTILIQSFLGSAVAYGLIVLGGLWAIVCSRVLVGLVKQTMTVTSSILAQVTPAEERSTHVGRLYASLTVAWIVGPSMGAYLYHNVGIYVPIYLSCCLFLFNTAIVVTCLPDDLSVDDAASSRNKSGSDASKTTGFLERLLANIRACSTCTSLASTVAALLLFQWVQRATSYKSMASFYETRYGMEPHQRGYLQSYQALWAFFIQSFLVRPIVKAAGNEVNAAVGACAIMTLASFGELQVSLSQYLVLVVPFSATAMAILAVSLKSLVSQVAPQESLGSVLAAVDILSNAVQVTVPFYRTMLFSFMKVEVQGDPDPYDWLTTSSVHWGMATGVLAWLLLSSQRSGVTSSKAKDV